MPDKKPSTKKKPKPAGTPFKSKVTIKGKQYEIEFEDDILPEPKTEKKILPHYQSVDIDQRQAANYQNQFVGLGQKPSTLVPAIQPTRERPQPAPVNRCVPATPCALPPSAPSSYSQQAPRAIADTRRQEVNAHRRNSKPAAPPSLPRLSMPRAGRGRGRR